MLTVHTLPVGMLQANCYIVHASGEKDCVVIDPGDEARNILRLMEEHGLECRGILLTHRHFDHVGAAKPLAEKLGCPVYLHEGDLTQRAVFPYGSDFHTDTYEEGDAVELAGLSFSVLHTPGHCPGCVCLQCQDALFTGDTLFEGGCGRTDFPGSSPRDMLRSLARLRDLPENYTVYPGHGGATTLDDERTHNPFLYTPNAR